MNFPKGRLGRPAPSDVIIPAVAPSPGHGDVTADMEHMVCLDKGAPAAKSNAELVEYAEALARAKSREPVAVEETRQVLGV